LINALNCLFHKTIKKQNVSEIAYFVSETIYFVSKTKTQRMRINVLIIDDDLDWREIISKFVAMNPLLNLIAACESAMEAYGILTEKNIDLMISDIEMPLDYGRFLQAVEKARKWLEMDTNTEGISGHIFLSERMPNKHIDAFSVGRS
jgi:CheY-like chemotaxis protein